MGGLNYTPNIHRPFVARNNRGIYKPVDCRCTSCGDQTQQRTVDLRKSRIRCEKCGGNVVEAKFA